MSTTGTFTEERVADVESLVVEWMTDNDVPGASVAIVDGNETVYAEGFGARNLAANRPATPETLYMLGSCSKTFTALAVLQLVERGALSLEDSVSEYLPVLEDVPGEPITVERLLTHTSGMPDDLAATVALLRSELGVGPSVPLTSRTDFYRHVDSNADRRLTDADGEFLYWNSGYTLLGFLVESVTDRSFPEYVTGEILEPVGMERSTYSREEFEATADTITPYFQEDERPEPVAAAFDEFTHANGGLMSPVVEMASFLSETVTGDGPPAIPDVDADVLEAMQRPRAAMDTRIDGTEVGYGYGWMSQPFLDDRLVGHGGSSAATSYAFWGLRDAGIGVAVGCNIRPELTPRYFAQAVLATLLGRDPGRTVPSLMLREKYDQLTGEYSSHRDIVSITVEQEGPTLRVVQETPHGERTVPLIPESLSPDELSFYTVTESGTRQPVEFYTDEDGVSVVFQRLRYRKR